jgi:hypothetical protein
MYQLHDTLDAFIKNNPENLFYIQDLGLTKIELGQKQRNQELVDEGIKLLWDGFNLNQNNGYSFRKLITILGNQQRYGDIQRAAQLHANYKMNLEDPALRQLLGLGASNLAPPPNRP